MKIVIDIPEDRYRQIKDLPNAFNSDICQAIRNGTVLPKGHGDLIDRDYFIDKYAGCGSVYCEDNSCNECNSRIVNKFYVDNAPTVIPADISKNSKNLIRYRFRTKSVEDFRPLIDLATIKMPYWCTGYGLNGDFENANAIIVCYLPKTEDLFKYWDDAYDIEKEECDEIIYTDRFPKPDWCN